jgi:hypothetical protein
MKSRDVAWRGVEVCVLIGCLRRSIELGVSPRRYKSHNACDCANRGAVYNHVDV